MPKYILTNEVNSSGYYFRTNLRRQASSKYYFYRIRRRRALQTITYVALAVAVVIAVYVGVSLIWCLLDLVCP